ncbi:hypothetical protein [Halovenus salina]|uniref:Uncharacterized protein n=1 Tax=Halovenus salina TaxID=1510225 RepID=A0ABD5VVM7_9EURY|nr:hypothetical protein [Halovenus salina]
MSRLLPTGPKTVFGLSRQHIAFVVLAVLALSAGCTGLVENDSADDSAPLDSVPAEADGVSHVKTAVLTDSVTESVVSEVLESDAVSDADDDIDWEDWEEVITEFENETDLSLDDVHSMTTFAGSGEDDEQEYAGAILKTDLDWETLSSVGEDETEFEEDSYNGVTVYETDEETLDESTLVADFGDGTFAAGSEAAVKDVIDTREGDAPGIDAELRTLYEGTTDGYVRVAATLSDKQSEMASDIAAEEGGFGSLFAPDAQAVTMSYHTEDDQLNAETDIVFNSSDGAETFAGFTEPFISPPSLDEDPDPEEQPIEWLLDSMTVDTEDDRVTLAFRAGPEDLVSALEATGETETDWSGLFGEGLIGQAEAAD